MFLFPKSGIKYQLSETEKHCNVTIHRSDHKLIQKIYTQRKSTEKIQKKKKNTINMKRAWTKQVH